MGKKVDPKKIDPRKVKCAVCLDRRGSRSRVVTDQEIICRLCSDDMARRTDWPESVALNSGTSMWFTKELIRNILRYPERQKRIDYVKCLFKNGIWYHDEYGAWYSPAGQEVRP